MMIGGDERKERFVPDAGHGCRWMRRNFKRCVFVVLFTSYIAIIITQKDKKKDSYTKCVFAITRLYRSFFLFLSLSRFLLSCTKKMKSASKKLSSKFFSVLTFSLLLLKFNFAFFYRKFSTWESTRQMNFFFVFNNYFICWKNGRDYPRKKREERVKKYETRQNENPENFSGLEE